MYWIVNLVERQVEAFQSRTARPVREARDPQTSARRSRWMYEGVLRGRIPVDDFMPHRRP